MHTVLFWDLDMDLDSNWGSLLVCAGKAHYGGDGGGPQARSGLEVGTWT